MKKTEYTITVYAITKNEEKFVERWYDSMSEADNIVVLDTGSTDKTVEILKSKGALVNSKEIIPWRFDVARNESMKLIPKNTDICVCTDLDEMFEPGWADALRKHWRPDTEQARYIYSWSHDSNGASEIEILGNKIHSNSKNWFWKMPVHEVITHRKKTTPNSVTIPRNELHLHHYPDPTKSRGQYLDLLKMSCKEFPQEYLPNYYYGRELTYHKMWDQAIEQLEKVVEMKSGWEAIQAAAYGFLAKSYEEIGNLEKAELSLITSINLVKGVGVREPFIHLLEFYYRHGKWYSLIQVGLEVIKVKQVVGAWYEDSNNYGYIPHDYLSLAFYNIGDYKNAVKHGQLALKFKPEDTRLSTNFKFYKKKIN